MTAGLWRASPTTRAVTCHGDCLEGLASGPAIAARWGRELDGGAANVALIAGYLGQLAASLVLLHMPERLVFGGGVMKAPGLIEALRRATERHLAGYVRSPHLDPGLERYICPPALGDDAGITGAILLGRHAMAQD
jgi:fructokinase